MKKPTCITCLGLATLVLSAAPGRADYLYLACQYENQILQFDATGNRSLFLQAYNPLGIAFDRNGYFYAGDPGAATITKYDPAGNGTIFASGTFEPQHFAFDGSGNLFVADVGTVWKFTPSGSGSTFATGLNGALDVAFDGSGNLYVANFYDHDVLKYDSTGNRTVFASGLDSPGCLAFDHRGNLYVANEFSNTIQKFDAQGHGTLFANSGLNQPLGLAVDSQDNLFVANAADGTIEKFNSTGQGSLFASGLPDGLRAITVVPEPSVEALVMLGATWVLGRRRFAHRSPN